MFALNYIIKIKIFTSKLQETNGKFLSDNVVYSSHHDMFLEIDEVIWAIGIDGGDYFKVDEVHEVDGKYYFEKLIVFSDYHQRFLVFDDSYYSELLDDYLDPKDKDVIEVIIDENESTDFSVLSRPDTWIKEGDSYYSSEEYIYDPYEQERRFLSKSEKKNIVQKIESELEIDHLVPIKDMRIHIKDIAKEVYNTNDYNKEELTNQIKNHQIFKEKLRNWGLLDENQNADILAKGAFAYIARAYDEALYDVVGELFDANYEKYFYSLQRNNIGITNRLELLYSSLEYQKISDTMHKLFLYKVLYNQ